jgi:hypothetical protein
VLSTGFVSTTVRIYLSSTDCTGTGYIGVDNEDDLSTDVTGQATCGDSCTHAGIAAGIAYYPTPGSIQPCSNVGSFSSELVIAPDGKASCSGMSPIPSCGQGEPFLGPLTTLDLSTLGFTPPFSLKVAGMP